MIYPESPAERDRWILAQRPARQELNPRRPFAFLVEDECSEARTVVPVATVFLTNRECPWRCLMCDLWRNTLTETVPVGAIPEQIDYALSRLPPARQLKLYNSGSFFDSGAIPLEDYPAVAQRAQSFDRVIVESHPKLAGERCLRFRDLLTGSLEVAMGLETVHPQILPRLNKRMPLDEFARAAEFLRRNGLSVRAFVLVKPPFLPEEEAFEWAARSLDFAFDCGASVAALIPTRAGNGAMDELVKSGEFAPPRLATLETAFDYGLSLGRGRVFADLWDVRPTGECPLCFGSRVARLRTMNLEQQIRPVVTCDCGVGH